MNRALILLAILLAFALRIYKLDAQSLWYDEGVTAMVAQLDWAGLTAWTASDIQPPLYYYVVAAWGGLTDWREWHLRWPSAWFGVLTVPLLVVMTRRLARVKDAALLVAFFAAIHPLLVYYGQEARMYSMLTAMVCLCGVLLLRASSRWGWIAYILAATAAVYTHYFAFFLLGAIGLAFLVQRLIAREDVRGFLLANVAILVLYLPWFGALFAQLSGDASFLPGQVKLNEVVRHSLITFIAGETILESRAELPLIGLALVSAAAILWLAWRSWREEWASRVLTYTVCWVVIPCAAILLLTFWVPKFNARYVMIVLPGLLLLWGIAAADLMQTRWGGRYLGLAITLILATAFSQSIRNWFTDDAFTKAQWRELAQHVRDHKVDGDAVVLVSGHTWPIWNYYAPEIEPIRLPDLEILDVNATLDYTLSGSILRDALAENSGAWLVRWQEQFVDPMGTARLHLDGAATWQASKAQFWHVGLERFTDLRADEIFPYPPTAGQGSTNFDNELVLLGHRLTADSDLLLYWTLHDNYANGTNSLIDLDDFRVAGQLLTSEGLPYHRLPDQRPAGYDFPTMRWQPGQINVSRFGVADWAGAGALAGDYQLLLRVYPDGNQAATLDILAPNGVPLGKEVALSLPLDATPFSREGNARAYDTIADGFGLAVDLALDADREAEPGESIIADLFWRAVSPLPESTSLQIEWLDDGGTILHEQMETPFRERLDASQEERRFLHSVHSVLVPINLAAGEYALRFSMRNPESDYMIRIEESVALVESSRSFDVPELEQSINALFGDEIELFGVVQEEALADGNIEITLAWRANAIPNADYFATVQILDESGKPVVQSDLALPRGSSNWLPDQVETQTFVLDASQGSNQFDDPRVIVAVYDAGAGFERLLLADGADRVVLR